MADPVLHNGSDGRVFVKPIGGGAFIEMDATKWSLKIKSNNKDVSGSKSGRKRIAGVPDADGSVDFFYDSANPQPDDTPSTGPNIRAGSILQLELIEDGSDTGGTESFRLTAIVDEVDASSEFDGTIDYNCTFSLADGSTLKYPGDA